MPDVDLSGKNHKSPCTEQAKRSGGGVTIEANVANLNCKTQAGEFQVDPLFRKTSAAFDEEGAHGMLLNNLSVIGKCSLVFDSSDALQQGALS